MSGVEADYKLDANSISPGDNGEQVLTVPLVFTLSEMEEHFYGAAIEPSAEDVETAGCRIGRNAYPALVRSLFVCDLLRADVASAVVPSAWSAVEFPRRALGEDEWSELFAFAGYTVEGVRTARPTTSLRLWRGSLPEHRYGWSWTDDRDLAQWFADRRLHAGRAKVWTADVEPTQLLARISEQRPGESEYVVDARCLRQLEAEPASSGRGLR